MPLKYNIYQSLESLPMWNFDKIQHKNDLRYMLDLKTYDKLPKINKYLARDLAHHYKKLIESYNSELTNVQKAKQKVVSQVIEMVLEIVRSSKDVEKMRQASVILRALMIDPDHEDFLWNVDFTETPTQKQLLTRISVAIRRYNDKKKLTENRKKQDLYEQTARIETILGVNIDLKSCSVRLYQAYAKEAISKVNVTNQKHIN